MEEFVEACRKGDIEKVGGLYFESEIDKKILSRGFEQALLNNHILICRLILGNEASIQIAPALVNEYMTSVCNPATFYEEGIKFMVESYLVSKHLSYYFAEACKNGHLKVVETIYHAYRNKQNKYLIERGMQQLDYQKISKDEQEYENEHPLRMHIAFAEALYAGRMEIIGFFQHVRFDLHQKDDYLIRDAYLEREPRAIHWLKQQTEFRVTDATFDSYVKTLNTMCRNHTVDEIRDFIALGIVLEDATEQFDQACLHGNLATARYFAETHSVQVSNETFLGSCKYADPKTIEFLCQLAKPSVVVLNEAFLAAVIAKNYECAKELHLLGATLALAARAFDIVCTRKDLEMAVWMCVNGVSPEWCEDVEFREEIVRGIDHYEQYGSLGGASHACLLL